MVNSGYSKVARIMHHLHCLLFTHTCFDIDLEAVHYLVLKTFKLMLSNVTNFLFIHTGASSEGVSNSTVPRVGVSFT